MEIRRALLAGSWYPKDREDCSRMLDSFRTGVRKDTGFIAGIVPHAGWQYSGDIACRVIEQLSFSEPDLVIIFGMHMHEQDNVKIMVKGEYETPFGNLRVSEELSSWCLDKYIIDIEYPYSFEPDNTIEVQLPIIRYFLGKVDILGVGLPPRLDSIDFAENLVSRAIELGKNPIVIGSTDLTHYGPSFGFTNFGTGDEAYDVIKKSNDKKIIEAMESMDEEKVIKEAKNNLNACCSGAAAGAIKAAKILGAKKGKLIEYANSYEKSKGYDFVGYAGVLFS